MKKKKILIIDDDQVLLAIAKVAFGDTVEVITIDSGLDAIEIMARHDFDLVVLDHQMPILDGFGTLKAIKQFWPDQKVVFCSTTVSRDTMKAFHNAGALGAICKPTNIAKLPVLVQAFF